MNRFLSAILSVLILAGTAAAFPCIEAKSATNGCEYAISAPVEGKSHFMYFMKNTSEYIKDGKAEFIVKNNNKSVMQVKVELRKSDWAVIYSRETEIAPGETLSVIGDTVGEGNFAVLFLQNASEISSVSVNCSLAATTGITALNVGAASLIPDRTEYVTPAPGNKATVKSTRYKGIDTNPNGNFLTVTRRSESAAGPMQFITDKVNALGGGTFTVSAQARLKENVDATCRIGLEVIAQDGTKSWPQTENIKLSTSWTQISGTVTIPANVKSAYFFIYTLDGNKKPSTCDIELDSLCIISPFPYKNIVENPSFDSDEFGFAEGWSITRKCLALTRPFNPAAGEITEDGTKYASGLVPANDGNIVYSGRWLYENDTMCGAWEGYAEIKFTGTRLYLVSTAGKNVYVSVDGGAPVLVRIGGVTKLAENLSSGTHTVRIIASAQKCMPEIYGFILDKNASTLKQEPKTVIEFVGDSITEGYINPSSNNYIDSYAYKTGMKLGWEFNTVAYGGITATAGIGVDELGMVNRYLKWAELGCDPADRDYDISSRKIDYFVLNLGTNDRKVAQNEPERFKADYTRLLDELFSVNKDATVFVMIPFNKSAKQQICEIVETYNKDRRIVLVNSDEWGATYNGTDGVHPDKESHDIFAEKLYEIIKSNVVSGGSNGENTGGDNPGSTDNGGNLPSNTGDGLNFFVISGIALLVCAGILTAVFIRRRKSE